jgi:hypothetical protein
MVMMHDMRNSEPAPPVHDTRLSLEAKQEAIRIVACSPRDIDVRTVQRALLEGLGRVRAFEVRELIRERVEVWRTAKGLGIGGGK